MKHDVSVHAFNSVQYTHIHTHTQNKIQQLHHVLETEITQGNCK